jgi:glucosamine--fructose-6-phosphate aminotransferase (isomerizing)
MCGIVGYIGEKRAVKVVLEGLTRLEYRGYDSAGVCFINDDGELENYKKIGKIENLKESLKNVEIESDICIGHTRWATHGKVTNENAHPHANDDIALIHNGIIENYAELKEVLLNEGEMFASQTDSEVFLVMITKNIKNGSSFREAVLDSFKKIKGSSSFVVLDRINQEIVCIKRGAPLVCGSNSSTKELLASSDPYALVGVADQIYFPNDEIAVVLNKKNNGIQFFDIDGKPSTKFEKKEQQLSLQTSTKGEFAHYMIKEIHEQPQLMKDLASFYIRGKGKELFQHLITSVDIQRMHIVACGTAYHAGLVMKKFFEKTNKLYTFVEFASEFRYGEPLLKKFDGGVFISQSGETADTLAAQELCQEAGLPTLSIVNVEGSTLYRKCDFNLVINAGFEIGVASTKAFTQMVLTGFLLSKAIANTIDNSRVEKEILNLSAVFEDIIKRKEDIRNIARDLHNYRGFMFTGRGKYFPIAMEGALKLKEIAYVHAEGYAAGELKHGPIALIDEDMVNVALVGPELYDKAISNIEEIKARKGVIFAIGPEGDQHLKTLSDYYVPVNFQGLDELRPLAVNLVLQLFAYYLALFKGTDIDKPRNLAKSVTVE